MKERVFNVAFISTVDKKINDFIKRYNDVPSIKIKTLLQNYIDEVDKHKAILDKLANMEELIVQHEQLLMMTIDDVKLVQVRNYVYARINFYRRDKNSKDIRILIGNLEAMNKSFDDLVNDKEFLYLCLSKLKEKSEEIIKINLNQIETINQFI